MPTVPTSVPARESGDLVGAEAAFGRADEAAMPVGRRRAEGSCATEAIRLRRSWRSGGPTSGATPTVLTSLALCSTSDRRSRAVHSGVRAAERGHVGAAEAIKLLQEQVPAPPPPGPVPPPPAPPPPSPAWGALRDGLVGVGAHDKNGTALVYETPLGHSGRTRQAWISYETVTPDYELVLLQSPIAPVGSVDLAELVKRAGQLLIGKLGFVPIPDSPVLGGGFLTLGTSIPLSLLTGDDRVTTVMFHLAILTGAAARLEPGAVASA